MARALQAQREVQAAPSPSVCPLPGERGGRWAQRGRNHRQPLQSGTKTLVRGGRPPHRAPHRPWVPWRIHLRDFGAGWRTCSGAGSGWASGQSSSATSPSASTPSSRCGRRRAQRRAPRWPRPRCHRPRCPQVSAARRERARVARRGADADGLQRELAGLLRRRERLRRRLRGLRVFGEYLRGVVAATGRVSVTKGASPSRVPRGCVPPGPPAPRAPRWGICEGIWSTKSPPK